jgi:type I pantothenate kinase
MREWEAARKAASCRLRKGEYTIPMPEPTAAEKHGSPFLTFSRRQWAELRASTPMTLTEFEISALRGINEHLSLEEVAEIHLPISRLLSLHVAATRQLHQVRATFLGSPSPQVPYVIGIAGSVAVGKSTIARVLQTLLSRWPEHPKVDLVTTDGFLYPNAVLQQRGLMRRKGFPESYDLRRLIEFVRDVKSGRATVTAPVYSHLHYDILSDTVQTVAQPDILILEGLNVLQHGDQRGEAARLFVSDYFDFSLYVDADETHLRQWFRERFLRLRDTAFQNPHSFFHRYATLSLEEALQISAEIWEQINAVNLRENIAPTRERASLILEKGDDHLVQRVFLRKL